MTELNGHFFEAKPQTTDARQDIPNILTDWVLWPNCLISQNIWNIFEKTLSGVRSPWFGLKKVPIQLSHILLPKLIWQAF